MITEKDIIEAYPNYRPYDLDISKQELDRVMKDYATNKETHEEK